VDSKGFRFLSEQETKQLSKWREDLFNFFCLVLF
jgi:hypothetical protein